MKEFKLEIDTNTVFIRGIRFTGVLLLGFSIGTLTMKLNYAKPIDWINMGMLFIWSILFSIFPGKIAKQYLTINEDGIQTHHYKFHWGEQDSITWEKISSISVERRNIVIKNTVGSSEKIMLPLHTKEQIQGLKAYLKEIAEFKKVKFKES